MDSAREVPTRQVRVLYFFAGVERFGDLHYWLKRGCEQRQWELCMTEIDLLRGGDTHDLSDPASAELWMQQVESHDFLLVTPPCSSFSRAVWANGLGPRPVRSAHYPQGFPWLSEKGQAKATLGNTLVAFAWKVLSRVH